MHAYFKANKRQVVVGRNILIVARVGHLSGLPHP